MSDDMLSLANRLLSLREEKESLEERAKALGEEIRTLEEQLVSEMVNSEVQRFTNDAGATFYLTTRTFVSLLPGKEPALIRWLRVRHQDEFIQEKVKTGALSDYIKELLELYGELPGCWKDFVKVYETTTVAIRRRNGRGK